LPPMTLSDIDELLDEEVLWRLGDLEVSGSEQRQREKARQNREPDSR